MNKDDKNAATKFHEVQNAYDVLSDEGKRAMYDQHGHAGVDPNEGGGGGPGGPFGGGFGASDFSDAEELFTRMFGGMGGMGRQRAGPQRGNDIQASVTVTFMESINGVKKQLMLPVMCQCETCTGTGSADGKAPAVCTTCKGTGQQTMQQGMYMVMTTCRKCGGQGSVIKNPCKSCSGHGTVRRPKTIEVQVPVGVDTGMNLRLPNLGDAGEKGAPPGHLYVRVNVEPDEFFQRHENDIHVRVPVSFAMACMGGEVTVPTVKGEVQLKIPTGSQPGDKLVLRGKGVKSLSTGAIGNQVVHVDLEVPRTLTPRQKELLQQLRDEEIQTEKSAAEGKTTAKAAGAAATWSQKLKTILNRLKT